MKNKKLTLFPLLFLVLTVLFSTSGKAQNGQSANPNFREKVCGYEIRAFGATAGTPLRNLQEAQDILEEVLTAAGINKNSVAIFEANVGDRLAIACPTADGKTTILFDAEKLNEKISNGGNNWVIKSIFAHEAGHIYYKHSTQTAEQIRLEGEADVFAGRILAKMQASLEETKAAYRAWIGEDKIYLEKRISTYPLPSQRIANVEKGWREVGMVSTVRAQSKKIAYYFFIAGGTEKIPGEDINEVSGNFRQTFVSRFEKYGASVSDELPDGYDPLKGIENERMRDKSPVATVIGVWVGSMEDLPKEGGLYVSKVTYAYLEIDNLFTRETVSGDGDMRDIKGKGKTQIEARSNALNAVAKGFPESLIEEIVAKSML